MDNYDLENWRKIKAALEAADKTDTLLQEGRVDFGRKW